jgi:hypothetical protein
MLFLTCGTIEYQGRGVSHSHIGLLMDVPHGLIQEEVYIETDTADDMLADDL